MINIIALEYKPSTACWVHPRTQARSLLAVAEEGSNIIRLYDGRGDGKPVAVVESVHRKGSSVQIIAVSNFDRSAYVLLCFRLVIGRSSDLEQILRSTMNRMTQSCRAMIKDSLNTGRPANHSNYLKYLGCGDSRVKRISTSLKRCALPRLYLLLSVNDTI